MFEVKKKKAITCIRSEWLFAVKKRLLYERSV